MMQEDITTKYLNHARQNQLVQRHTVPVMDLPVCPKCERAGFRDRGWKEKKVMVCPHCHYEGPSTVILRGYMKEKLYR